METLLLILDSVAMAVLLFYSRKNDKLKEGEPQLGFFRFRQSPSAKAQPPMRGRGRGRL